MRRPLAVGLLLVLTVSCSKSPPAQPARPADAAANTPAKTPDGQAPEVNAQAESSTVETRSSQLPAGETSRGQRTSPLAVGDLAPDFRLQDQNGTDRTLKELLAGGKVALVFYRSADW